MSVILRTVPLCMLEYQTIQHDRVQRAALESWRDRVATGQKTARTTTFFYLKTLDDLITSQVYKIYPFKREKSSRLATRG